MIKPLGTQRGGFDVLAQARRYDGNAAYISRWLPALKPLPAPQRHAPFLLNQPQRAAVSYPPLLIDTPSHWRA